MKKLALIILLIIGFSCAKEESNLNSPPVSPTKVSPVNNLSCTELTLDLTWNTTSDPDGNALSYIVELSNDAGFTEKLLSETTNNTNYRINLEKDNTYYWRVLAKDIHGATSTDEDIWSFNTENTQISNHLPYQPSNPVPANNSSINTGAVKMEWTCTDIDNDPLLFDIYLGETNNNLTLISENNENFFYNTTLSSGKTYYWRVDAKDNSGGITEGVVWEIQVQ
ncbi:fibronectin type III domain-containing protein [Flavicella marina]|uniref:fibronectin type III domain-containing protein n=1 Tax=Flavicella marina TaxID=1475951 RepID=UPI0012650D5B|nr:fibronectin type III domain-containing protein [Flavicella marina]